MIPILYEKNVATQEKIIGYLSDAISCEVTEERNGMFELTMQYPVKGAMYDYIDQESIIKARPSEMAEPQYFRVYNITKPMNMVVTINAEHISYELNGIPVVEFHYRGNAAGALPALLQSTAIPHNFVAESDITTSGTMEFAEPNPVRKILGGAEGSMLDTYGGEYEWDNFRVILHARRGTDTGVVVEYGKNLMDIQQETDLSEVVSGILPYARKENDGEETCVTLAEKVLYQSGGPTYYASRIAVMDFTDKFSDGEEITQAALKAKAQQYMQDNAIGDPHINITIQFAQIWQSEEYQKYQLLERVGLCDTLTVRFVDLGIDARAKVVKTTYDVLKDRYTEIELGNAKSNFADTFSGVIDGMKSEMKEIPKTAASMIQEAVDEATNLITGAEGGHVVTRLNDEGKPEEILIMDTEDVNTAKKVWRWNMGGFGYSENGVNGPYETAITMDGTIVGKFIVALTIAGAQIKTGRISAISNKNVYFDLDTGVISASDLVSTDGEIRAKIGTYTSGGNTTKGINLFTGSSLAGALHSNSKNALMLEEGSRKCGVKIDDSYAAIGISAGITRMDPKTGIGINGATNEMIFYIDGFTPAILKKMEMQLFCDLIVSGINVREKFAEIEQRLLNLGG